MTVPKTIVIITIVITASKHRVLSTTGDNATELVTTRLHWKETVWI